jgi:hypothetical protein
MFPSRQAQCRAFGLAAPAFGIEPAFTWLFADGRTSDNFLEYLLLSNPSKNQARVTVEFVLADGELPSAPLTDRTGQATLKAKKSNGKQPLIDTRRPEIIINE